MTEEQPHPQRCHNNCNNLTKKGSCLVATRKLSHVAKPHQFDNGEGLYITQSERDLIAIIGCAAYTNNDPTQMHIVTSCPLNDNCGDCNKQPYFVCSELVKQKKDAECSSCIYKRFAANMRNAKAHDAAVRKEALAPIVAYLNKHLEEENMKIRLSNEVGNADAGNRAGDIWAAYYGTLIQIPESLRTTKEGQ